MNGIQPPANENCRGLFSWQIQPAIGGIVDCFVFPDTPSTLRGWKPRLATRSRYPFHIAARHRALFPGKPVANAAHGLDQVGRVSEFFTERTDVDVDRAFQGIGVFTA